MIKNCPDYTAPVTVEVGLQFKFRLSEVVQLIDERTKGQLSDLHFELKETTGDVGGRRIMTTQPVVRFTVYLSTDVFTGEDLGLLLTDLRAIAKQPAPGLQFDLAKFVPRQVTQQ